MGIEENEILKLEVQNVKRIERLELAVGELKEDIAGLPGKILQAIGPRHMQDRTWQWAAGIILVALGSGYLLLHNQDINLRSEIGESLNATQNAIHDHTQDRHPTRVEASVQVLGAIQEEVKHDLRQIETHIKAENEREARDTRELARLAARDELIMQAVVEAMKNSGSAGRAAAETRGRTDEALRALEREILELRGTHGNDCN